MGLIGVNVNYIVVGRGFGFICVILLEEFYVVNNSMVMFFNC